MDESTPAAAPSSRPQRSSGSKRERTRRTVVWDEDNLAHLEKTKTPKQKIDEPKTPYHPSAPHPDEDGPSPMNLPSDNEGAQLVDPEQVRNALDEVASKRGKGGWTSSEDEGDAVEFEKWMEDRAASTSDNQGTSVTFQGTEEYYGSNKNDKAFKEHRKRHYDEFRRLKQLKGQGKRLLEEDGEDVGIDEEKIGSERERGNKDSEGYSGGEESDGEAKTGGKAEASKARLGSQSVESDQPSSDEGNLARR